PALTRPQGAGTLPTVTADCVVLGAGPAGLGAALALARDGARVTLVEAADAPGGLCRTRARDGLRYDLGGHIPFVRDARRREWLRDLLRDGLVWVPRPVSSVRDGRVRRGRYLDQRAGGNREVRDADAGAADASAAEVLPALFGARLVESEMRTYLEKIDGVPLRRIPAARPLRLMRDQAAPDGFWFPRGGIGRLMEAMAGRAAEAGAEVRLGTRVAALHHDAGGVTGVTLEGDGGRRHVAAPHVVVALPAGAALRLLDPPHPAPPSVPMRAVCLVYVRVAGEPMTDEAWIQVDDPSIPFARVFEMGNWDPGMADGRGGAVGMECYCDAGAGDPLWGLDDATLTRRCVAALVRLGWLDDPARATPLEVVRMPGAYPLPDLAHLAAATAAPRLLAALDGVHLAPGSEVLAAVEAGERAAAAVALGRRG
ncbi:MAG TPA: FAD-dependent oxidoreductase, partial [Miltoncostaeaceae bacterium]|nr:FAD-dependent oxidoreductase [Miltoncostaeaceae bacterium]